MSEGSHVSGWRIERSVALELDVAAWLIRMGADALPKALADLAMAIPKTWSDEYDAMDLGAPPDLGLQTTMEPMARWAGVLEVGGYDPASAAMREITPADAIAQIAVSSGLEPNTKLPEAECLLDIELRLTDELWGSVGVPRPPEPADAEREAKALRAAIGSLRGQPLHGRFWHWMDRFYYEAYRNWRETREDAMVTAETDAAMSLGSSTGTEPPDLEWLPSTNPILTVPTIRERVTEGELDVVFWSEPFGLSGIWALAPGLVLSSFAQRGPLYEQYVTMREDLVTRLKALADPTRVSILRMIRAHDLDNTKLARHLEVSRPTVSVHAKVLADAGFISTRLDGRKAEHSYEPEAVAALCADLVRFLDIPKG